MSCTSSTTRASHAADEDESLRVALVVFDAARSCEVRLARQNAPHDGHGDRAARDARPARRSAGAVSGDARDARRRARTPHAAARAGRLLRAVPGPLRRGRAGRPAADIGPAALRAGPRLVPLGPAGLRPRLVSRARPDLAGPRRRGRASTAPCCVGDELTGTTQVVGWRRVWARRRTEFVDAAGALVAWTHVDWVLLDARGAPTRIPVEFEPRLRGAGRRVPPRARPARRRRRPRPGRRAVRGPPAGARPDGPRQQRGLRRLARRAGHRRRWRWPTCGRSRGWPAWSTPARPRRARRSTPSPGATDDGWSCRIADAAGTDLLRARLERIPRPTAD